jgi:ribosomal protein S18 acetylase RimI-like enzyme
VSEIIIRDARPDEIPLIHAMGCDSFQVPEAYDWGWTPEILELHLDDSFGLLHVAELDGAIAGFHCGVWNYPESNVLQCRMYWLYVKPEMRGRGLARRLIQRSLDEAAIRGKTSICIGVWSSDTAARTLVESFGLTAQESLIFMTRSIEPTS